MKKVCIMLAVMLAVSLVTNLHLAGENLSLTQDRNEWEDTGRRALEACHSVDDYVDKTCDTGEMDEFVQSQNGQDFYHWYESASN